MATDVDKEKDEAEDEAEEAESKDESRPEESTSDEAADESESKAEEESKSEESDEKDEEDKDLKSAETEASEETDEAAPMPTQMGHKRFVYAAYLAAAIAIAFVSHKLIDYAWYKLHDWKPDSIPDQIDELSVAIALVLATGVTVHYWRQAKARILVEEVAEELTKVTWPTRQEVTSSTTVVIITTLLATVFFALMDQFWLWVTKHVYGS
jgi:preprotein translocase subunit SecE